MIASNLKCIIIAILLNTFLIRESNSVPIFGDWWDAFDLDSRQSPSYDTSKSTDLFDELFGGLFGFEDSAEEDRFLICRNCTVVVQAASGQGEPTQNGQPPVEPPAPMNPPAQNPPLVQKAQATAAVLPPSASAPEVETQAEGPVAEPAPETPTEEEAAVPEEES